ncbi:MAG: hypothetical protein R3232_11120 [Clostridia bacterium]|nr:hypothetical protein [Clostridia bacterium]
MLNKRNMELSDIKNKSEILSPERSVSAWYISVARTLYGKNLKADSLFKAGLHFLKRHIFVLTDTDSAGGKIIRFGHMIKKRMVKTAKLDTIFHSDEYYKKSLKLSIKCIEKSCELIKILFDYLDDSRVQPLDHGEGTGWTGPYGLGIREEIKQDFHSFLAQAAG